MSALKAEDLVPGGLYNWKYQPERLVYVGKVYPSSPWYMFEKVNERGIIWCEALDEDMHMLEEAKDD